MAVSETRRQPARLSYKDGQVMVTPEDKGIFFISAEKATEACKNAVRSEERVQQFEVDLIIPLRDWCLARPDKVAACYFTFSEAGMLPVFIVGRSEEYDFALSRDVSDLAVLFANLAAGHSIRISPLPAHRMSFTHCSSPTTPSRFTATNAMPSSPEHKDKAVHNRQFLDTLDITSHADWAAVVAFYTALHLIERLSAGENKHHGSHAPRGKYLARHTKHSVVRHHYQALYDAAHVARYGTINQFQRAFPKAKVKTDLIDVHLAAIDVYVTTHFAPPTGVMGS